VIGQSNQKLGVFPVFPRGGPSKLVENGALMASAAALPKKGEGAA
jgi:hypothetical protein